MPAVSKAQQRFMGMVHAVQKGDMEAPSKEIEKAADSMSDKDAKDYASTSHKGLSNKKENMKITRERLKELVKEVMTEESEYQAFFQKALDKAGKSIPSMSDEEKKEFFSKIDTAWNGRGEKTEGNAFGAAVSDAKEKGEDEFEVGGEKYKVEETELPAATIPASVKSKLMIAIDKIKDTKLTYNQKIQVVGKVMDSLGVDKGEFNKMSSKLKGTMESSIKSIKEESPCWKGYKQIGMKDKGGKQVPNCVPA